MLSRPLCAWLPCAICDRLSRVNKQRLQNQALGGCAHERRNSWREINPRKEQSRVRREAQTHCQISFIFIGSWEKQFEGGLLPVLAVLGPLSCFRFCLWLHFLFFFLFPAFLLSSSHNLLCGLTADIFLLCIDSVKICAKKQCDCVRILWSPT